MIRFIFLFIISVLLYVFRGPVVSHLERLCTGYHEPIYIRGCSPSYIAYFSNIQAFDDGSLQHAKDALQGIDIFEKIVIQRKWFQSITVHVKEHIPVACFEDSSRTTYLVNRYGHVMRYTAMPFMPNLPLLKGVWDANNFMDLMTALKKFPHLLPHLRYSVGLSSGRWNLVFHSPSVTVKLPHIGIDQALTLIQGLLLSKKLSTFSCVDLRIPERCVVQKRYI